MNKIEVELANAVAKYRRLAKSNYYFVFFLYAVAVAASFSSTIMALNSIGVGRTLATTTAIPGAILILTATFRFAERAKWHYDKKNQLQALLRLVSVQPPSISGMEVAERWNKIDAQMEKSWPGFGLLSSKPTAH